MQIDGTSILRQFASPLSIAHVKYILTVANSKSITGVGKNKDKWTRRACPVTLKFATATKRHDINLLLEAYRGCVNRFIKVLWTMPTEEFGLNGDTLALIPAGRLSERYKSNALKQAIEIVVSTKRAAEATGNKINLPEVYGQRDPGRQIC